MKKWLLAATLLTFLGTTAAFTASMQPINRQATPEDPAIFQITIKNNESTSNRFILNNRFVKSGWMYHQTSKTLQPGETGKINVSINPGEEALQQTYSFTIYVTKFSTGETVEMTDYMSVNRKHELNIKEFKVSETSLEPGERVKATITVQNLASRIVDDYALYSTFNSGKQTEKGIPVAPGALKTYSFTHQVSKEAWPGKRNFSIVLNHSGTVQVRSENITIQKIRNITRKRTGDDRVLYETGKIILENQGNSNVTLSEKLTLPGYLDSITTFEPKPGNIQAHDSRMTYEWNVTLQPGESKVIEYRTDYWMPLTIAAVILLGILLLRRLSGSVKIVKRVEEVEEEKLKISIELKNNSEKIQNDLKVKDFVPNVAQLDEDFQMTEPDTKRTTEGVELEWKIDDFTPGEERVIQYEIEPKVEVEGGIDLESAELQKRGETLRKSSRK